MLVLSRKVHQKILFPGIHAAVEVVAIKGGAVRLGIEAPPGIVVLREELQQRSGAAPLPALETNLDLRDLRNTLRNRLNTATVGEALPKQQDKMGISYGL